jgi:HAD superfamily hydrolase (TIGR01490 family)
MSKPEISSQIFVFVDLDGTLISPSRWLPFFIGAGLLRKLHLISLKHFKEISLIPFRDWTADAINSWGTEFYIKKLKKLILPNAVNAIEEHREKGHILVLATGSPDIYLRSLASDLKFHHLVCTLLEYRGGRFTGRIAGEDCLGINKLKQAANLADQAGADLRDAYCYTDSISDKSLIEAVGNPRVVSPQRSLRRKCYEKGWPITVW